MFYSGRYEVCAGQSNNSEARLKKRQIKNLGVLNDTSQKCKIIPPHLRNHDSGRMDCQYLCELIEMIHGTMDR